MKTSLLIMAAGIGSRFGGGIKQLEPVGIHDEIIMDYSIHDAIVAGFNKIIFVIRKDIEKDFRERIGDRVEKICKKMGVEIVYAFQSLEVLPEGCSVPTGRTKPWGTGQAVLAAKDIIHEPFAVINADDYYGREAFKKIHDYLSEAHQVYCMAGFILKNTLSENGGVTRGLCKVNNGMLSEIVETKNIIKTAGGAAVNGRAVNGETFVSMNMWGFPTLGEKAPDYLRVLENGFKEFLVKQASENPMNAEYLLPDHIGKLLEKGEISVQVLETDDKWFGVTYKEDKDLVVNSFRKLINVGVYAEDLYSDLF